MYLLDTVICIHLLNGNQTTIRRFQELGNLVSISVINVGELLYGAYRSKYVSNNVKAIINLLERVDEVYRIDAETSWIYGRLKAEIIERFSPKDKQRGFKLESLGVFDNDLWIASIAVQHKLILISLDHDFKRLEGIENLKVEIW